MENEKADEILEFCKQHRLIGTLMVSPKTCWYCGKSLSDPAFASWMDNENGTGIHISCYLENLDKHFDEIVQIIQEEI